MFGSGRTLVRAVDDVSFETGRGEVTLIIGPSGSDKTTLLTMIGALLRPTAGRVLVDGLDMTGLPGRDLARKEGCAVVAVSHGPRLRDIADRVLWLEDGRLEDAGATAAPAGSPRG